MELSVAIQAKVEVTPSNWNFGFQPTYLHGRDYFGQPDASPACSFAPQGLFPPAGCISILLFCSTGITLPQPNASLSCSFAPQGLFPPAKCISIFLFCSTGIISAGQIHLYLALLLHRDYFRRPDSSLSRAFAPQGLFPPAGFISILLFCYTGIILPRPDASLSCFFAPQGLLCPSRMHLYLALLFHKDYFDRPNASLSCSFVTQGLFTPVGFIPSLLFCSTGIISVGRMHLYLPLLLHRDYFHGQMHLYLALLLHRDYFAPVGCIPIFLFCSTGIISAGRMHLYLALLLHRDYFRRPDSSLSCSFVSQGLFPPAKCISILLFCFTEITSAGRMHL